MIILNFFVISNTLYYKTHVYGHNKILQFFYDTFVLIDTIEFPPMSSAPQ